MSSDLQLQTPTVTLFGAHDALGTAVSDELGRRGRSTHTVTTPVGWLSSATYAVVRLDSVAGERALQDLVSRDVPATHVVAVCELPRDGETSARLDNLCRRCGDRHEISVIWHPPFEVTIDDTHADPLLELVLEPDELAVTIVDEVRHQEMKPSIPSFASQVFAPHRSQPHPDASLEPVAGHS
jgi:hypothetical protein